MKKQIVLFLIFILFYSTFFCMFILKSYEQPLLVESEDLDNYKESIAINIQQSPNTDNYTISNNTSDLNGRKYKFNDEKSFCIMGGTIEYDENRKYLTVKAKSQDRCIAYFDLVILKDYVIESYGGINAIESLQNPDLNQTSPI